jgi:Rod binding domain-containing protein
MWSKISPLTSGGSSLLQSQSTGDLIDDRSGRFNRLQSAFQKQLKGLANDFYKTYHTRLVLTDTVRTYQEQAQAHREKPTLALSADNPHAMHLRGLAVDMDLGESKKITPEMLAHNGLHRPALSKGETWHLEPDSTRNYQSSSRLVACSVSDDDSVDDQAQATSKFKQYQQPRSSGSLEQQSLSKLGTPNDSISRLHAAREIESIFLEQLLGQMRSSMVDTVGTSPKELRGYLSMADQQFARALAAGGGIGLAEKIIENLASLESHPKTENSHDGKTPVPQKSGASA